MSLFGKVLIPVDFSLHALKAVRYGRIFQRMSSKIVLAHVIPDLKGIPYEFPAKAAEFERAQQEAAESELLDIIAEVFGRDSGVGVVVAGGDIYEELLQIASRTKADLIIMGTQGRRNLGHWFLGSVTERILRRVPIPILTVRESDNADVAAIPATFKHILYATDLSDDTPIGARVAASLARAANGRLTIINVLEYHDFVLWGGTLQLSETQRTTINDEARNRVGGLIEQIDAKDLPVETVVTEGKAYQKILHYADHHDVDLIVLNLQGKTLIERAALGSTAERIVRLANVPVLSVPAKQIQS